MILLPCLWGWSISIDLHGEEWPRVAALQGLSRPRAIHIPPQSQKVFVILGPWREGNYLTFSALKGLNSHPIKP